MRMARDVLPLMRFGVSAVAEDHGKRQGGSSGGGGRLGLEYFVNEGDDMWTKADEGLIEQGTMYAESRSVFSAETIPNHVAMMTGVVPERSGIPTNNFLDFDAGAEPLILTTVPPSSMIIAADVDGLGSTTTDAKPDAASASGDASCRRQR